MSFSARAYKTRPPEALRGSDFCLGGLISHWTLQPFSFFSGHAAVRQWIVHRSSQQMLVKRMP